MWPAKEREKKILFLKRGEKQEKEKEKEGRVFCTLFSLFDFFDFFCINFIDQAPKWKERIFFEMGKPKIEKNCFFFEILKVPWFLRKKRKEREREREEKRKEER